MFRPFSAIFRVLCNKEKYDDGYLCHVKILILKRLNYLKNTVENVYRKSYYLNCKQTSVTEIHLCFQSCVVVYVNWNKGASAISLNHCSTCILIQSLHIYEISRHYCIFLDVLLTVHLSIFISVINQPDAQNFVLQWVYFMPLHVSSTCAHHQDHTYRCDDTRGCVM